MDFGLWPRLGDLPMEEWRQSYPNGLGASAFSSPGWQAIMRKLLPADFEPCALVAETDSGRYSLPVFVRRWTYGRVEIGTHPVDYYVLPIECERADGACVRPLAAAARTAFTRRFRWWLPPWTSGSLAPATPQGETYVIELTDGAEQHLQTKVRRRFLEYVRSSYRRGLEIVERPSENEIEQYWLLSKKNHEERGWIGDQYSLDFFVAVASTLGDGGRLVLMRHEGRVVGGGTVLFDRHAVHYFQGAIEREITDVRPHVVLYDWLIREAGARGLKYVNLGGVNEGNHSLDQFKRSWGAAPVPTPHVGWDLDRTWLKTRFPRFGRLTGATPVAPVRPG